jgi:phenylpyruvate tautomerase PptA (4-oxalocrotonate tautomerase family)
VPYVEIKAFERRFEDERQVERLIQALTNAVCDVLGESTREHTRVVVEGVSPKQWGFGGKLTG